jgi:hypothetical protein
MAMSPELLIHTTTLEEIGWGSFLLAVTTAIHAVGMTATLSAVRGLGRGQLIKIKSVRATLILASGSVFILFVHLFEVLIWASFFVWTGALPTASVAFYYALNQYTTVGSDVELAVRWQLLSGFIATAGLMTFAWSTSVLLTLVQENFGDAD